MNTDRQIILRRYALSGSVLFLLFLGLYYQVIMKLISQWSNDPNYSHGFIVPLISAYLIWEKGGLLKETVPAASTWGFYVLAAGLLLFVLGNIAAELLTMRISMLVVLAGLIISIYGFSMFKAVLLPYGYLYFMIPLPYLIYDSIAFPLKLFVAKYSVLALQGMSIPVHREGNIIMLPHTILEVADACSGIRSLMSLFALGIAFAYFSQKTLMKKIILAVFTIPIAIFANAGRVIGTGILAHFWGAAAAEGFFHEFAGLTIFAVSMALMFSVGVVLNRT